LRPDANTSTSLRTLHTVKLIILDRDGVVSSDPDGRATRAEDWQSIPGAAAAISRLHHHGYRIAILADCGALDRGTCDMAALNAMHSRMVEDLATHGGTVDVVLCVPGADAPDRNARVAATLTDALERLDVSPSATVLVTDSQHELDAAHTAGLRPVLVLTGHGRDTLDAGLLPAETAVRVDLTAVAAELAP
jgi:D-glycero-D-manno-heptose 1,7-bisphosphate phosphatase